MIFLSLFDTALFIWPSWGLTWWDLLCQFLNTHGQGRSTEYQWKTAVGKYVRLTVTVQSGLVLRVWPTPGIKLYVGKERQNNDAFLNPHEKWSMTYVHTKIFMMIYESFPRDYYNFHIINMIDFMKASNDLSHSSLEIVNKCSMCILVM